MPLHIVRDNIVHMHTDAIVNAANETLSPGGGVCGSVFDVAGYQVMLAACRKLGGCKTGGAVITEGFGLPAKYVIHAVGPIWKGGSFGEEELLRSCYRSALMLAVKHELESISFPLISSGIFGYPKDKALVVAVSEITQFLMEYEMTVNIVVYDRCSFELSGNLFETVESYINDTYVNKRMMYSHLDGGLFSQACANQADSSLSNVVTQLEESFSQSLLRLIDEKGKTDVEVYKKANIDRRLFSKIRSNMDYKPSKETVAAMAIALELSLDETKALLATSGFTLSHSSKFDIILEYFIKEQNYNIFEINEALFAFGQKMLGV